MSNRARNPRKRVISEDDSDSGSSDEVSIIMRQLKVLSRKVSRLKKKRKIREPSPVSSDGGAPDNEFSLQNESNPDTFGLVDYDASDSGGEDSGAGPNGAIPEGFLALLGKNSVTDQTNTEDLNNELAQIWSKILQEGLDPEVQATMSKKYSPPNNLVFAGAPKINLEVFSVLTEQHKQRDQRLSKQQNQMGAALVAIGKAITVLLKEAGGANRRVLIEWLSDAGRLLSDVHHEQSSCRRTLVSVDVDKQLRATLTNVSVDGLLFGKNLGERVKAARDLEKLSSDLKLKTVVTKPTTSTKPLNLRSLPRGSFGGYRGRPKYPPRMQTPHAKRTRKFARATKDNPTFYRRNQTKDDRTQTH